MLREIMDLLPVLIALYVAMRAGVDLLYIVEKAIRKPWRTPVITYRVTSTLPMVRNVHI